MDGADVCRTSRRHPDVISALAILDPRWRGRKWRHPGPGARFSIPIAARGAKWRPFRFRSPSWMTSFAGTGNEVIQDGDRKRKGRHFAPRAAMGIEKRALYYYSRRMRNTQLYVSGKRPMHRFVWVIMKLLGKGDGCVIIIRSPQYVWNDPEIYWQNRSTSSHNGTKQIHAFDMTLCVYCKLKKAHFFKVRLINPFFTIKTENTKSFLRGLLYNPFIYNGRTGGVPVLYHNSLVTVACKSTVYCYHEESDKQNSRLNTCFRQV